MTEFYSWRCRMFVEYNPNPIGRRVGDCAVRAIAKALNTDWKTAYILLCMNGFELADMPSADYIWGSVLRRNNFERESIPNLCPECYTAEDFCLDNKRGIYVIGFGGHTATVVDGNLFDSWDSSKEIPQFVWRKQ
jgi:hypothetical protein